MKKSSRGSEKFPQGATRRFVVMTVVSSRVSGTPRFRDEQANHEKKCEETNHEPDCETHRPKAESDHMITGDSLRVQKEDSGRFVD